MAQNEASVTAENGFSQENEHSYEQQISTNFQIFLFELECIRPDFCYGSVVIPEHVVAGLYHEAAVSQQKSAQTYGFHYGKVPIEYIKHNFTENLLEHIKELLFKFCVINFLYEQISINKLVVVGDPRLYSIDVKPDQDARFTFEISLFSELSLYEWKFFPFKAPKRKNYKDLDRQVDAFIEEERTQLQTISSDSLTIGDWVGFTLSLVDGNEQPLLDETMQYFWFKLGSDDTESPLRQLFLGKRQGDVFYSNHEVLQAYLSDQLDANYTFRIDIKHTVPYSYFCFDAFKRTFRIKTNKDMHKKLIEVFSYRNDVSQRYAMVQESFRALLAKHRFSVPNHLVLRQQNVLLDRIKHNPDYHVYRAQKDFDSQIRNLAEKQVIETIFIDKLAYHENILVHNEDVIGYLNLTNRPRMKEFIYFDFPTFKMQGQEVPIPAQVLKRMCLREKAINYVIYHLTKK